MALSYLWPSSPPPPLATTALPSVSPAPSPPHGWANSNVIWPCVNRHDLIAARMANRVTKERKCRGKVRLAMGKCYFGCKCFVTAQFVVHLATAKPWELLAKAKVTKGPKNEQKKCCCCHRHFALTKWRMNERMTDWFCTDHSLILSLTDLRPFFTQIIPPSHSPHFLPFLSHLFTCSYFCWFSLYIPFLLFNYSLNCTN